MRAVGAFLVFFFFSLLYRGYSVPRRSYFTQLSAAAFGLHDETGWRPVVSNGRVVEVERWARRKNESYVVGLDTIDYLTFYLVSCAECNCAWRFIVMVWYMYIIGGFYSQRASIQACGHFPLLSDTLDVLHLKWVSQSLPSRLLNPSSYPIPMLLRPCPSHLFLYSISES